MNFIHINIKFLKELKIKITDKKGIKQLESSNNQINDRKKETKFEYFYYL